MVNTFVPPSGNVNARYVIIGEQPGRTEVIRRQPFVGPAGENLDECLRNAGISRSECYFTNVIKTLDQPIKYYFPTLIGGKREKIEVSLEGELAIKELRKELLETSANVIIPCGNVALYALTSRVGITNWRGSILESTLLNRKCVPTIHPATYTQEKLWKDPTAFLNKHLITMDLKKAKLQSAYPEIRITNRKLLTKPNYATALEYLARCKYFLESGCIVWFDIELTAFSQELSCISFAISETECMCIPFVDERGDYFAPDQEAKLMQLIGEILEHPKCSNGGQNVIFDAHFLLKKYGIRTIDLHDTMIAQKILYPEFRVGLNFITAMWTDIPYYKDEGKLWLEGVGSYEQGWQYNCLDSISCADSFNKQLKELEEKGNLATYERKRKLIEPLTYMMFHGIKVDRTGMLREQCESIHELEELSDQFKTLTNGILYSSPKQLAQYFYITKGIQPYLEEGKITTNIRALHYMLKFPKVYQEVQLLLKLRRISKRLSTYLDLEKVDDDGRLRCSYNPVGCLLPETEVLTPYGWLSLENYNEGQEVLQWDTNDILSWTSPKKVVYDVTDNIMLECQSQYHNCIYTIDHRIPSYMPNSRKFEVRSALETSQTYRQMPTGGLLNNPGKIHNPLLARILAMVQADGSFSEGSIIINVKSKSKADRCKYLLDQSALQYTTPKGNEGYYRFYIRVNSSQEIINLLGKQKLLGNWLLLFDLATLDAFLDEIRYWDSYKDDVHNSYRYNTIHQQNAEWVATIAHLCGKRANISYREGGYTPLYRVSILASNKVSLKNNYWKPTVYTGKVYCLETETGYFLARYKGKIFVTGNTKFGRMSSSKNIFGTGMNLQNVPANICEYLVADDDYIIYTMDLSQYENRIVAYVGNITPIIEAFESGKDMHKLTAGLIFSKPYEQISDKPGSSKLGDGEHSERDWGKIGNHAFAYGLGYKRAAQYYEISTAEAKFLHDKVHQSYPGIENGYWAHIQSQLRKNRTVENLMGRKVLFLGKWTDQLLHEAYCCLPQGTCADVIDERGIQFIYYNTSTHFKCVELLTQIHDSISIQMPLWIPLVDHAKVLIDIKNSLETPLKFRGREFVTPVDLNVNFSLNKYSGINLKKEKFSKNVDELAINLHNAIVALNS